MSELTDTFLLMTGMFQLSTDLLGISTFNWYNERTMYNTNSLSISDLRQHAASAVDQVADTLAPTIILKRSKPKAVLVEYNYFQALEEALLDLTDAAEAEKAKEETTRPLDAYLAKRFGKSK